MMQVKRAIVPYGLPRSVLTAKAVFCLKGGCTMYFHNSKHAGILLLVLGCLLLLPALVLGRMPLAGIAGLLLLVTGGLLTFAKDPGKPNQFFP